MPKLCGTEEPVALVAVALGDVDVDVLLKNAGTHIKAWNPSS